MVNWRRSEEHRREKNKEHLWEEGLAMGRGRGSSQKSGRWSLSLGGEGRGLDAGLSCPQMPFSTVPFALLPGIPHFFENCLC